MSHELETMAWVSETPWHGLGVEVSNDLSANEMLVAAGCDWTVSQHPMFSNVNGQVVAIPNASSLVRNTDNHVLDIVGEANSWNPLQNSEAFGFFKEFVDAGDMSMETAGSLKNGKHVWALAKVKSSFELFNGDRTEAYLLFTNPHSYGKVIDVRFTAIRVVCNNTLTLALSGLGNAFKSNHRTIFNAEKAKEAVGLVQVKMDNYKEAASYLGSKLYTEETVSGFFDEVFPVMVAPSSQGKRKTKDVSKSAQMAKLALIHQPGVEFAPGSWWQAFNAVTYVTDHLVGREQDNRVENMWYGAVKDKKVKAFSLAKDYADRA